jgi:hypothetical protein
MLDLPGQPSPSIPRTRCGKASGANGLDKYGCPAPSNSMIRSALPVIIRTLAPTASACLASVPLEPSITRHLSPVDPARRPQGECWPRRWWPLPQPGDRLAQAIERAAGKIRPDYRQLGCTPYWANFSGAPGVPTHATKSQRRPGLPWLRGLAKLY